MGFTVDPTLVREVRRDGAALETRAFNLIADRDSAQSLPAPRYIYTPMTSRATVRRAEATAGTTSCGATATKCCTL
jgi:hypothetical protein